MAPAPSVKPLPRCPVLAPPLPPTLPPRSVRWRRRCVPYSVREAPLTPRPPLQVTALTTRPPLPQAGRGGAQSSLLPSPVPDGRGSPFLWRGEGFLILCHTLTRRAPAKINLTLDVGPVGSDDFHPVRTVMQTIALADTLTVTHTPHRPGVSLAVTGPEAAGVPNGPENLVYQAAVRMQKIAAARRVGSAADLGVHIDLVKTVPSQAGLGGGSSDAAAALLALDTLWELNLSRERLTDMAAALGSDVPFFLHGGTALCEGRGERVTPLPALSPDWPLVIVKPPVGVSTAAAYRALDALPHRVMGTATERWPVDQHTANDFEAVVYHLFPEVGAVRAALADFGAGPRLCGSGAALWCRAASDTHASRIAEFTTAQKLGTVWVTRTENTREP